MCSCSLLDIRVLLHTLHHCAQPDRLRLRRLRRRASRANTLTPSDGHSVKGQFINRFLHHINMEEAVPRQRRFLSIGKYFAILRNGIQ